MRIAPGSQHDLHRSGWRYAMAALEDVQCPGIILDGFIEESHSWELRQNIASGIVPYSSPWIGFFHNPCNMPGWYHPADALPAVLARETMQQSLRNCLGLLTLSHSQVPWLRQQTGLLVSALRHPGEVPDIRFNLEAYRDNPERKIVQVGYWLRKLFAIQRLPTEKFEKLWLVTQPRARKFRDNVERLHDPLADNRSGRYREIDWISHQDYDRLLSRNLVFAELYDAAATNVVIDCMARATPLLINPLPAVVEYLGADYPLYFSDLREAAKKAESDSLVEDTHHYLQERDTRFLKADYFRDSFINSEVFRRCESRQAITG